MDAVAAKVKSHEPTSSVNVKDFDELQSFAPSPRAASPSGRVYTLPFRVVAWQTFRTSVPLLLADAAIIIILSAVCRQIALPAGEIKADGWGVILCFVASSLCIFSIAGLYPAIAVHPSHELRQISIAIGISTLILSWAHISVGSAYSTLIEFIACAATAVLTTFVVRSLVRRLLSRTTWWPTPAIIIGTGADATRVASSLLRHPQRGLRPIGFLGSYQSIWRPDAEHTMSALPYLGAIHEAAHVARDNHVSWIVVALSDFDREDHDPSGVAHLHGVRNILEPASTSVISTNPRLCCCGSESVLRHAVGLNCPAQQLTKRFFDMTIIVAFAPILLPVMALIALMVKLCSPAGSVLYCQKRVGRAGTYFTAWKFRTMIPDADQVLKECLALNPELHAEWMRDQKLRRDPRIIPWIGRILRKTSLDELPQLWNVIRRDMSLVGPRPIVEAEIVRYGETYRHYNRVLPGLTGLWQVSGRNNTTYDERVELDCYYVTHWSLWMDFYILLRTVKTVVLHDGAY